MIIYKRSTTLTNIVVSFIHKSLWAKLSQFCSLDKYNLFMIKFLSMYVKFINASEKPVYIVMWGILWVNRCFYFNSTNECVNNKWCLYNKSHMVFVLVVKRANYRWMLLSGIVIHVDRLYWITMKFRFNSVLSHHRINLHSPPLFSSPPALLIPSPFLFIPSSSSPPLFTNHPSSPSSPSSPSPFNNEQLWLCVFRNIF